MLLLRQRRGQRRCLSQWFRFASQWFRYADEEIRNYAGDFIRRPPSLPPEAPEERQARIRNADSRLTRVGFESGRCAAIDDMRWVRTDGERCEGSVALLWDVHNKPEGMGPYRAAKRVIEIASVFGSIVDMSAYVSPRMLCFPPLYTREYNRVKPMRIVEGEFVADECFNCLLCGAFCGNHVRSLLHFRNRHEAIRTEQICQMRNASNETARLNMRKKLLFHEDKYREVAKKVLTPRVLLPDGLPMGLVRAGFFVRQMHEKPAKAPDIATWTHICQVANLGVACICYVSDSSNCTGAIDFARRLNTRTVLIGIGHRQEIKKKVNLHMTWEDVVTGRGMAMAEQTAATWAGSSLASAEQDEQLRRRGKRKPPYSVEKDDMFFEYYEDLYPSSDFSSDDESEEDGEVQN